MSTCDNNHDEIVYDSRVCPLCTANGDIEDLNDKIEKLEEEIEDMKLEAKEERPPFKLSDYR